MILFSYTCIVSVLEFFVAVQAHTTENLNSNELLLSLSNEQVTEYNYERTIKSATTENNQAHSVTTNIKTDFVHTIHSSKELDLSIADSTDIDETLNMEIMSELNMLNNNEALINSDYGTQNTFEISNTEVKIEGDTAFMSQNGINISPNYNTPTNTIGDLTHKTNGQDDDSNGNKLSDSSFTNKYQSSSYNGNGIQNQVDNKGGIPTLPKSSPSSKDSPSNATPTSPNKNINSAPNSNQNAAPQSTAPSATNSNQYPFSSSPNSLNGDSTGQTNGPDNYSSLDGNFDTQNNENYVDGYFGKIGYMQEPFNEPYAPNLDAGYENSQLQYGFNQNSPPFKDYPYMENDIETFDTNSYADISSQIPMMNLDLYNYNNIDGIEYDQTNIGIDKTSLENNQLSMSDLNTFLSTQNSQKIDSFIDTDLTFDHRVYNFVDARNEDLETIDSNNIGKVNKNNLYNGQGFIGYNNMESINVPEYNQFTGDYAKTYLSNLGSFETSSSNTRSDAAVDIPEGPYLTPQLLNSNYNLPTSNDLNKQSTDLNSLLIDNAQFNGYLFHKIDTLNVNNQVEGFAADTSNVSPMNAVDNRFNSIQTTVLSKNIELDVGHNVYDANGQVIGIINKPSGIVKTKNRHTFSRSSSYSSPNDSEFSDDIDAIGKDIKRGARDAIGNLHDNLKGAHDTTKAIAKTVGNIAGNAASKAADGIKETTKTAYQDSKDALKGVGNAVDEAANDVEKTAKTAYQGSKDAVNDIENAINNAAYVKETVVYF